MWSLFILSSIVGVAKAAVTLTSDNCVDASSFEKCHSSADSALATCINQADADGSQEELLACGCANYETNFNCYATYCWNRVWECEYQSYLVEYLDTCPIAKTPLPYFPIPDNAEDACSCNVGKVYESLQPPVTDAAACMKTADLSDYNKDLQILEGCQCCEISALLSNIYASCPDTDPSLLFLDVVKDVEKIYGVNFTDCAASLAQFNCVSDLGFTDVEGGTFFSPDNLPKSGTNSFSNGPGTVTAPASGSVFTYTNSADSEVFTITAASAGKQNSAKTTTAGSNKATGTSTGSGSGGSPAATGSNKNISHIVRVNRTLVATLFLLSYCIVFM